MKMKAGGLGGLFFCRKQTNDRHRLQSDSHTTGHSEATRRFTHGSATAWGLSRHSLRMFLSSPDRSAPRAGEPPAGSLET